MTVILSLNFHYRDPVHAVTLNATWVPRMTCDNYVFRWNLSAKWNGVSFYFYGIRTSFSKIHTLYEIATILQIRI